MVVFHSKVLVYQAGYGPSLWILNETADASTFDQAPYVSAASPTTPFWSRPLWPGSWAWSTAPCVSGRHQIGLVVHKPHKPYITHIYPIYNPYVSGDIPYINLRYHSFTPSMSLLVGSSEKNISGGSGRFRCGLHGLFPLHELARFSGTDHLHKWFFAASKPLIQAGHRGISWRRFLGPVLWLDIPSSVCPQIWKYLNLQPQVSWVSHHTSCFQDVTDDTYLIVSYNFQLLFHLWLGLLGFQKREKRASRML